VQNIPPDPGRKGAVAILIRDGRMLVIRRSRLVVAPGAWCFPGGALEPGESEPEALTRELQEELRLTVRPVRCVWRSRTPWQVDLAWWLSTADDFSTLEPNPAEVESVHWLTAREMAELAELLESNRQFLQALADGRIDLQLPPQPERPH
jgi:8-oxo-dGTP diphosphatase